MILVQRFAKPEYLFRPKQVLRRLARGRAADIPSFAVVDLPWGLPFEVAPRETIGGGIWRLGVHELVVSEALWRLVDAGESVADVGANSGYFTGLLACRTGADGRVWAFEPHPEMHKRLARNVDLWGGLIAERQVTLQSFGLSDLDGHTDLHLPPSFEINTGTAYIPHAQAARPDGPPHDRGAFRIETRRLDTLFTAKNAPAVMKIDVEGHEWQVLAGAGDLLSTAGIRDVVFEEHQPYPAASMRLLEERGYSLFGLARGVLRPKLNRPDGRRAARAWEAPNYLATLDPDRAQARLRRAGWACLSAPKRRA